MTSWIKMLLLATYCCDVTASLYQEASEKARGWRDYENTERQLVSNSNETAQVFRTVQWLCVILF
jgi:hypothetical protein